VPSAIAFAYTGEISIISGGKIPRMLKTFNQTKTFYPFFLFLFTLFLTLSLALPWVSAQEPSKPKAQPWHIDGIIAALDDGHDKVKDYAFWQLIRYEPQGSI